MERKNVVEGMNVVGEEGNVVENEGNVAEDRVAERWEFGSTTPIFFTKTGINCDPVSNFKTFLIANLLLGRIISLNQPLGRLSL